MSGPLEREGRLTSQADLAAPGNETESVSSARAPRGASSRGRDLSQDASSTNFLISEGRVMVPEMTALVAIASIYSGAAFA
jgi:hypothetical protein